MSPFAAFWQCLDIAERKRAGLIDKAEAKEEENKLLIMKEDLVTFLRDRGWLTGTENDTLAVLKACLSFLAASQAGMVLINLEDLWLETRPQNIPSTKTEYPSWQNRARYSLEEFCQLPEVVDTLRIVNLLRKRGVCH
jgi:4-alpha-glucanotransferase